MKRIVYLFAAVATITISCKNEPTPEETALMEQKELYSELKIKAEEVHDIVMEKMGEMAELRGKIEIKMEAKALAYQDSLEMNAAVLQLKKADADMMEWMRDYSSKFSYGEPIPGTKDSLDQKTKVLKEEVNEIITLKEQTLEAISNATALLNN